jgi:hypothetical protein
MFGAKDAYPELDIRGLIRCTVLRASMRCITFSSWADMHSIIRKFELDVCCGRSKASAKPAVADSLPPTWQIPMLSNPLGVIGVSAYRPPLIKRATRSMWTRTLTRGRGDSSILRHILAIMLSPWSRSQASSPAFVLLVYLLH